MSVLKEEEDDDRVEVPATGARIGCALHSHKVVAGMPPPSMMYNLDWVVSIYVKAGQFLEKVTGETA
uniref:Uncharacterized protein n=1 Tax=Leersia perrieri TaxID=77586 RepID=A0A0D9V8W6_9ORYZ